jgi:hypothetical protein
MYLDMTQHASLLKNRREERREREGVIEESVRAGVHCQVEAVRALVRHGDAVTRKAAEAALEAMAPGSQPRRVGLVDGLDRHYFQLVHAPPGSGYRPKGHRGDEKVVGVAPEEPPFNVQPGEPYILDGIAVGTGNWVEPWQYAIKELPMSTT